VIPSIVVELPKDPITERVRVWALIVGITKKINVKKIRIFIEKLNVFHKYKNNYT
jgi:hypothetical protein